MAFSYIYQLKLELCSPVIQNLVKLSLTSEVREKVYLVTKAESPQSGSAGVSQSGSAGYP